MTYLELLKKEGQTRKESYAIINQRRSLVQKVIDLHCEYNSDFYNYICSHINNYKLVKKDRVNVYEPH